MKNNTFLLVAVMGLWYFTGLPGAGAANTRSSDELAQANAAAEELLKIEPSNIVLQQRVSDKATVIAPDVDVVINDTRDVVAPQQQPLQASQGASIAGISQQQTTAIDPITPSTRWRNFTLDMPNSGVAHVKEKESKELKKLNQKHKEKKELLRNKLNAMPSRAGLRGRNKNNEVQTSVSGDGNAQ